jgi:HD-GYP domain-containing protein (c-di-GMP phosphodiesterase class II)
MLLRGRRPKGPAHIDEWTRRPGLSRALRAAIFLGPILASLLIAILLNNSLPHGHGLLTAVLVIGIVAVGSFVTLVLFERAARRLLPLAALLNVSLLFPDRAPARFAVARRTGTPRQLQEQLIAARAGGRTTDAESMQSIIELVLALSVHDKATRGHSERVRVFTDLIADELKIDAAGKARLRWAALLHDVGKLEVPASLLNKPAAPDAEEWKVLHRHPEDGARLVAPLLPWLGEWGRAVAEHHERYDGTGYPHRLKGNDISLAARIVAVADVYEVMTAPRPYKRAMSIAAARQELTRVAGTQLDPAIVRAFLNISVGRLWRTIGFGAWIGQIPAITRLWTELGHLGSVAGAGAVSAGTATLITLGSLASPLPSPAVTGVLASTGSSAHTTPSAGRTLPHARTSGPTTTPRPSVAAAPPTPRPAPHPKPKPKPKPKPAPPPPPPPHATPPPPPPPPSPPPGPGSCAGCTNTSPVCTNHCRGDNRQFCTSYCLGDNNHACTSHCFGNNDPSCRIYCVGHNDPRCKSECWTSGPFVVDAITEALKRSPGTVSSQPITAVRSLAIRRSTWSARSG